MIPGNRAAQLENNISDLYEMLSDMEQVGDVYRPSNYWMSYHRTSLDYIETYGLEEFRSPRFANWSSFGAVTDRFVGAAEPILEQIKTMQQTSWGRAIRRVMRKLPILRYYAQILDSNIFESLLFAYKSHLGLLLELSYEYCRHIDTNNMLSEIEDSGLGAPNVITAVGNKRYTRNIFT